MKKKEQTPIEIKTFSVEEVMVMYNKSKATLYNWMEKGILSYRQFPGERRFTIEDLKEINENLLVKSNFKSNHKTPSFQHA